MDTAGVSRTTTACRNEIESIQPLGATPVDESCIMVNGDELHFHCQKDGKHKPYQKKIRDAISSRMRSTRKKEYRQLALLYGDDANTSECNQGQPSIEECVSFLSSVSLVTFKYLTGVFLTMHSECNQGQPSIEECASFVNSVNLVTFEYFTSPAGGILFPEARAMDDSIRPMKSLELTGTDTKGPREQQTSFRYENVTSLPASIDWRKRGAVTPIKNQAQCGNCWAFLTIAATEGIHQLTTGQLISLPEQVLVDCDKGVDQGCEGGEMENAVMFIINNHGIASEATYPYKGDDGTFNKSKEASHAAIITSYEVVPADNERTLQKAVANQPVSCPLMPEPSDMVPPEMALIIGSRTRGEQDRVKKDISGCSETSKPKKVFVA
ncbi:Vignain [Hibiscus syriacus]|uniref:Vignain n=1 Tax=Hibiscus syriacus TaxID=106335 RepID=A0A6A2ZKZ1_HIBSY|nr:Vignain [Hibiscus syriacus]